MTPTVFYLEFFIFRYYFQVSKILLLPKLVITNFYFFKSKISKIYTDVVKFTQPQTSKKLSIIPKKFGFFSLNIKSQWQIFLTLYQQKKIQAQLVFFVS